MALTRRRFVAGALAALATLPAGCMPLARTAGGKGPLVADPGGILDLPEGFRYRIVARPGEPMDDGLLAPGRPDGMAALRRSDGRLALIRNHELGPNQQALGPGAGDPSRLLELAGEHLYDRGDDITPGCGGTTTLVLDPVTLERERLFLSLAGTERNCAGGPTPWNSWLSCEEAVSLPGRYDCGFFDGRWGCRPLPEGSAPTRSLAHYERAHGYAFEVPADADGPVPPRPLTAMGRFYHEAAAVDPRTGIVYLTEDRHDGLVYRYLPNRPGQLDAGGILQALAIRGESARDTGNGLDARPFPVGRWQPVEWVTLADVDAPEDDLRQRGYESGAARFVRGEGAWFADGELVFTCTEGGRRGIGQIFRYRPGPAEGREDEAAGPGQLMLFVEAMQESIMQNCDNITVSPWGDLVVAEDAPNNCRLLGVTPQGTVYELARHPYTDSELAGVCFSPDGRHLFVNVQEEGVTLAIAGPWPG